MGIHVYTWVNVGYVLTWVNMGQCGYTRVNRLTWVYMGIHGLPVYTGKLMYTRIYTLVYTSKREYTQVYTCIN